MPEDDWLKGGRMKIAPSLPGGDWRDAEILARNARIEELELLLDTVRESVAREERLRVRRTLLASVHPHITANEIRNVMDRICPE